MSALAKQEGSGRSISTSPQHFLIITICGRYLALDAEPIQGVLTNEEASPFQDLVVQGTVYGVIDLAMRLNLPSEGLVEGARLVLLKNESSRKSVRVDQVHGILKIQKSQVLPFPAQFRGPERRWYLGMIPFNHSVALILNIAWILEDQIQTPTSSSERYGMESVVAAQGAAESKNQRC